MYYSTNTPGLPDPIMAARVEITLIVALMIASCFAALPHAQRDTAAVSQTQAEQAAPVADEAGSIELAMPDTGEWVKPPRWTVQP